MGCMCGCEITLMVGLHMKSILTMMTRKNICIIQVRRSAGKSMGHLMILPKVYMHISVQKNSKVPPVDPPEGAHWVVFDGKTKGTNEDADVRCTWLSPKQPGAAGKIENSDEDSERNDDSDSDSSSVDSNSNQSESSAASLPAPALSPSTQQHIQAMKEPISAVRPVGRACAKMLVRTALRCGCHFMYVQDCPAEKKMLGQG